MAKIKKKAKKANESISKLKLDTLKVGDVIFYLTPYTVDKTYVERIDEKSGTAILKNQVRVNPTILTGGNIQRVGDINFKDKATIKLWSESVESEYIYHVSKKSIPNDLDILSSMINDLPKESVIQISNKIKRLINKFKI